MAVSSVATVPLAALGPSGDPPGASDLRRPAAEVSVPAAADGSVPAGTADADPGDANPGDANPGDGSTGGGRDGRDGLVPVDRPDAGRDNGGSVRRPPSAARTTADPAFVRVGTIGATSALIPLGLHDDGTLEVPVDFAVAGWYALGPRPGDIGAAVIAGHLDSYNGPAVFARLPEIQPGDDIEVTRKDGSIVRFVVTRIDLYPKDRFPTMAVYGPTAGPELRLITCGGTFDRSRGSYRDNVVVYARMVGA